MMKLSSPFRNGVQTVLLTAVAGSMLTMNSVAESPNAAPAANTQTAVLGGGCFWCLEAMFQTLDGVLKVTPGYAGGRVPNPTYKQVCTGTTGHAEVVRIEFDPARIRFEEILEAFWDAHDPTTLNRQGPDVGTQYRSIILVQDDAQRQTAEQSRKLAAQRFRNRIVTQIVTLEQFYPAEEYHHDYFRRNPNASYCAVVIRPKLQKFKSHYPPKKDPTQ